MVQQAMKCTCYMPQLIPTHHAASPTGKRLQLYTTWITVKVVALATGEELSHLQDCSYAYISTSSTKFLQPHDRSQSHSGLLCGNWIYVNY